MAKKYSLNEYFQYANNCSGARIELYPDNNIAGRLFTKHMDDGYTEISISDCLKENSSELPLPNELMRLLDDKIESVNSPVIITGIDSYLFLISHKNKEIFMIALKKRLDSMKQIVVYLISTVFFDSKHFSNPKYYDSLSIVCLKDATISSPGPQSTVTIFANEWSNNDTVVGWKQLIKKIGRYMPSENYTMSLLSNNIQAGLSDNVISLFDIIEIAEELYGIPKDLPETCVTALLKRCKSRATYDAKSVIEEIFDKHNVNPNLALKRLVELEHDDIWQAYIWYLKKSIDKKSYLYQILIDSTITNENILSKYVDSPISLLTAEDSIKYRNERALVLNALGKNYEPLIIEFIQHIKNLPNSTVFPWLNCNTKSEHIEILHRLSEENLDFGPPAVIESIYCNLADYLTLKFDYPDNYLNIYFKQYRHQRITEIVTEQFVNEAFESVVPDSIEKRDAILNEFRSKNDIALLTVDGMGAEYYPLILSMAQRAGIAVEYKAVAEVRLPSSTEYNSIAWDSSRIISSIHEIDNISHDGDNKYEENSYETNLVATLDTFNRIINTISNALTTYSKVMLTADHGSSRLAVVAYNKGMTKTLSEYKNPENWRYMIVSNNQTNRPDEFESHYDAEKEQTYWVVKGYNRLSKKGGKISVHGGATLEERLVPVILFTRQTKNKPTKEEPIKPVEQLVEKAGFDDI